METVVSLLAGAVFLAFATVASRVVWTMWRATMSPDRPLPVHRMFERQGLNLRGADDYRTIDRAASAARRCAACREADACVAWLQRGETSGYAEFCPNAGLIDAMKRERADTAPGATPAT